MFLILPIIGNIFVFIICLMGAQTCYFKGNWKWLWLMLVCVALSGGCLFVELSQIFMPGAPHELPTYIRQPTTPL